MPVIGEKATQLIRGMALNLRPVWSLDEKQLAYISDYSRDWHVNFRDVYKKSEASHGVLDKTVKPS